MLDTCGPVKVVIEINHNLREDELMSCTQDTILSSSLIQADPFDRYLHYFKSTSRWE